MSAIVSAGLHASCGHCRFVGQEKVVRSGPSQNCTTRYRVRSTVASFSGDSGGRPIELVGEGHVGLVVGLVQVVLDGKMG